MDKSNLELAMELIANRPELVEGVEGEEFATFWEYPEECINRYDASIAYLKTSFQYTDEMIQETCIGLLKDVCIEILNLKTIEAQNEQNS